MEKLEPKFKCLKMDDVGKIYLPQWLRQATGFEPGDEFDAFKTNCGDLVLKRIKHENG